jgi:hypothetical protein
MYCHCDWVGLKYHTAECLRIHRRVEAFWRVVYNSRLPRMIRRAVQLTEYLHFMWITRKSRKLRIVDVIDHHVKYVNGPWVNCAPCFAEAHPWHGHRALNMTSHSQCDDTTVHDRLDRRVFVP